MKIAIFLGVNKKRVTGYFFGVDNLQRGLEAAGHEVAFVTPSIDKEERGGIYNYKSPDGIWTLPNIIDPHVFAKIDKFKPDIIHAHGVDVVGIAAIRYAFDKDIPIVFTAHSEFRVFFRWAFPWYLRFWLSHLLLLWMRSYLNLCDTIIAPTSSMRKYLIREGIKIKIVVQPSGIELKQFKFKSRKLKRKVQNLLYVGSLTKRKNVEFLLQVMLLLDADKYCLHVVGGGVEFEKLKKLARQLDNVKLFGQVDHQKVAKYYKQADLFVFASVSESQGLVYIEAMIAGLPVITLENLGSRSIIVDSKVGYIVQKEDPKLFARTVQKVMSDKKLYEELSRNAFEYAKAFDLKKTVPATVRIYEETISRYKKEEKKPKQNFVDKIINKFARFIK